MLSVHAKGVLLLSFLPYLGLAAYDGWLHEKARRVPRIEQVLHAALAVAVLCLWLAIHVGHQTLMWTALTLFALAAALDECGFHRALAVHERRLHHAAYACFAGFVGVALGTGVLVLPWA